VILINPVKTNVKINAQARGVLSFSRGDMCILLWKWEGALIKLTIAARTLRGEVIAFRWMSPMQDMGSCIAGVL
jgi:hypothetical protein